MSSKESIPQEEKRTFQHIKIDEDDPQKIISHHPVYKGSIRIKDLSLFDVMDINRMRSQLCSDNPHNSDILYAEWVIWTTQACELPKSWPNPLPAKGTLDLVKEIYTAVQDFLA